MSALSREVWAIIDVATGQYVSPKHYSPHPLDLQDFYKTEGAARCGMTWITMYYQRRKMPVPQMDVCEFKLVAEEA